MELEPKEDNTAAAEDVASIIKHGDAVIVLSASGTTPYALQLAKSARTMGATIIGLANNPATGLLDLVDVPICLQTPPEAIAGSTRLGAGTAQKAALNLMSSLMGIKLGHVYQGQMVNVVADNAKLTQRAVGIIARIAKVSDVLAEAVLNQACGNVKSAILVAFGSSTATAQELLAAFNGHLGPCIRSIKSNQEINV